MAEMANQVAERETIGRTLNQEPCWLIKMNLRLHQNGLVMRPL